MVRGPGKVGKTCSVRRFGHDNFQRFVEFNLLERPDLAKLFASAGNSADLIGRIQLAAGGKLVENETLIFFDEVQECQELVTAVKFLVEDGRYRYILSGSLLGVSLDEVRSMPVGYMDVEYMHPLDFEEFMTANGIGREFVDALRDCFWSGKAVDRFIHEKVASLFRTYLVVGGMPEAVRRYVETGNLSEVLDIQRKILAGYREDISKHDPRHRRRLLELFDALPSQLDSKNKRFYLNSIDANLRFTNMQGSFYWLREAGLTAPAYCVDEPKPPLLSRSKKRLFKLFMSDVGLLSAGYGDKEGVQIGILGGDVNVMYGAMIENIAAQEFVAGGFNLYYFNSKKLGEFDFVLELGGKAVPVVIGYGKNYWRLSALDNVLDDHDSDIDTAYVFGDCNCRNEGKIRYRPAYMLTFLRKNRPEKMIFEIDLSGLA